MGTQMALDGTGQSRTAGSDRAYDSTRLHSPRIKKLYNLLKSSTEDSWCKDICSIVRENGIEQTIYAIALNKSMPLENAFVRSSYSSSWRTAYDAEKLHYIDPTVSHCLKSTTPLIWEPSIFRLPDQKPQYFEACDCGVHYCITYPIHGPNAEFGVISFVSNTLNDKKFQRKLSHTMANLALIRDYVFESSLKFLKKNEYIDKEVHLTEKELECLKWAMAGKSSWEISMILGCSTNTVNFHISILDLNFRLTLVSRR